MTDQFIDYVNSDQDVQYADTILIRDISAGTINENTVNQVLAKMGLSCKVFNNKNALGMYLFGELFWQDQPKTSADRFEDSRPSAMNHGFQNRKCVQNLHQSKSTSNQLTKLIPSYQKLPSKRVIIEAHLWKQFLQNSQNCLNS